jgi:tetratricopeptide (TPR) repeat protein
MILRALVLAILAASSSWAGEAAPPAVRFAAGVEALKQDRPSEAAEAFDALAREVESASVYYNLGLARYHQGQMGKAVAAWRRALDREPWSEDAQHNLVAVTGSSPFGEGFAGALRRPYLSRRVDELEWITLALLAMAVTGLGLWRLGGRRGGMAVAGLSLALAGLFGVWAYARHTCWLEGNEAVILGATGVEATAGPGGPGDFPRVFVAHPGQVVLVHRSSGRYRQVSLSTGAAGWVPQESLEEL